jgi:hypothetical protein
VPGVGVADLGSRWQIGRIGEDSVEGAETPGEIRENGAERQMLAKRCVRHEPNRKGIEIRSDHVGSPTSSQQSCESGSAADLQEPGALGNRSEREQEFRIFPRWIHMLREPNPLSFDVRDTPRAGVYHGALIRSYPS